MGPPEPPFICGSTNRYTFCAPSASGDYYLALPHGAPPSNDVTNIRRWFENESLTPQPATILPEGLTVPQNSRAYNVSEFLPKFLVARNGTREDVVGPNCYQASLCSAGYSDLCGRYVHTDEFRYYLNRFFSQVLCGKAPFGSVVVYDRYAAPFDAGDHAAFLLLGNLVFHKGGWLYYYPYETVPMDHAMSALASHWRPTREDRLNGTTDPGIRDEDYRYLCYERRDVLPPRPTSSTSRDINWYLPLFEYYIERIKRVSNLTWNAFKESRLDLLTIENMHNILRNFSDRVGMIDPMNVLLTIGDAVVEKYLELESLSWQYFVMTDTYDPIREGVSREQLQVLYRDHYVTFNEDFYGELRTYLRLLGVPEAEWNFTIETVVKKIKTYNPTDFSQSNGLRGIPYLQILAEVTGRKPKALLAPPEITSDCQIPTEHISRTETRCLR